MTKKILQGIPPRGGIHIAATLSFVRRNHRRMLHGHTGYVLHHRNHRGMDRLRRRRPHPPNDTSTLPSNPRATALLSACGHRRPRENNLCGDVFIGRCIDDEAGDIWTPLDFTERDCHIESDWCVIARMKCIGGGTGGDVASSSSVLSQWGNTSSSGDDNGGGGGKRIEQVYT